MKLLGYLGLLVLLDYTESYRLMPLSLGSPIGIVDNVWWNPAEESYGIFNLTEKNPNLKKILLYFQIFLMKTLESRLKIWSTR